MRQNPAMPTSTPERFEAIGPRGEACIIIRTQASLPSGETQFAHSLATGERLKPVDPPGSFETMDGKRVFRLRA